jgi:hypothetical protein
MLARVRSNEIPDYTRYCNVVREVAALVAPISARYTAAQTSAREAYHQAYAAAHQPDDAAWEKELQRRASLKAMSARRRHG